MVKDRNLLGTVKASKAYRGSSGWLDGNPLGRWQFAQELTKGNGALIQTGRL